MKVKTLAVAITTAMTSPMILAEVTPADLPSMIVSADFRPNDAHDTPISLTTIDEDTIESRGAQHIEDVLNLAPNVNVSSGASRGQYFQIRGIGERSEFQAPLNPSVGLYIDGIDFSRSGGAATLFDIESVEILRGPQGTRYGANGMAGTINLKSTEPTNELAMKFESTLATYNTHAEGIAVGGPLIDNTLLGRFSVHSYKSDGFMDNDFLGRDNTQNRDEVTARGHLKWLATDNLTIDLNVLHLNIDNGYDAFTLDNSRHTLSDQPGKDAQNTNAFALKTDYRANDKVQLQSSLSYSKSNLEYSYDDDWSYKSQFDAGLAPYSGFDQYKRKRENTALEFRALSNENGRIFANTTDWTLGLYVSKQRQNLDRTYYGNDITSDAVTTTVTKNSYETVNTALYGQLDTALTDKLTLISGLRAEYWEADYKDSAGLSDDPDDWMYGGKLGLEYHINDDHMAFTTLSRGYKAGGINVNPEISDDLRSFNTESLWNLEAGLKSFWLDGDLITSVTAFYTRRSNAQIKSSFPVPKTSGGTDFIDYFVNADRVRNIGLEAELDWSINEKYRVIASLGLLDAKLEDYENPKLLEKGIKLSGRRIAHAPAYQFNLGGEYYFAPGWTFKANMEGKDEFYYSNSHNAKSHSFVLYNASVEYKKDEWKVTLWGRNLFDKDYYTRGFSFGIDPSKSYAEETYTQYGDPRVVGLTLSYDY